MADIELIYNSVIKSADMELFYRNVIETCDDGDSMRLSSDDELEIVESLLKDKTFDPRCNNSYIIERATRLSSNKVIRLLLDDGRADPATYNNEPLYNAISIQKHGIIKLLLNDPRVDASRAFSIRCINELIIPFQDMMTVETSDTVQLLLNNSRTDPSIDNNYLIYICCHYKEFVDVNTIYRILQDSRVDPSDYNNRALKEIIKWEPNIFKRMLCHPQMIKFFKSHILLLKIKSTYMDDCILSCIPNEIIIIIVEVMLTLTIDDILT